MNSQSQPVQYIYTHVQGNQYSLLMVVTLGQTNSTCSCNVYCTLTMGVMNSSTKLCLSRFGQLWWMKLMTRPTMYRVNRHMHATQYFWPVKKKMDSYAYTMYMYMYMVAECIEIAVTIANIVGKTNIFLMHSISGRKTVNVNNNKKRIITSYTTKAFKTNICCMCTVCIT